ncbi:MAG: hypothetical protein ACC631_11210, partial [Halocynthiibacter sp.]
MTTIRRNAVVVLAAFLLAMFTVGAARAGCAGAEAPCKVAMGSYHIVLPETAGESTPLPVVVFLHGAGGSGGNVLRNRAMVDAILARGYALIAPNGIVRAGRSGKRCRKRRHRDNKRLKYSA